MAAQTSDSNQSPPPALVNRLLKAVPFLKAWAKEPAQPASRIAESVGINSSNYVYEYIIPDFVNIYDTAMRQEDFPTNILTFYNQHGSTAPEHILDQAEVHALKPVYEREKERIAAKLQQRTQTFMSNPGFATGTRPPHTAMLSPSTSRGQAPNMGTNAALISSIMENIRLAPVGMIPKFLKVFEQAEDFYMTHPAELEELFKSQFGPMPGTVGFRQFMITQPYYVYNAPRSGYGNIPPAGTGTTYSSGLGPGTVSGYAPPGGPLQQGDPVMTDLARQEAIEQNKEERRMRYMQNMASTVSQAAMMNMMQRSMESKQPIGLEALQYADVHEEYDAAGNLVGKKIVRRADAGNGGNDRTFIAILDLYKQDLAHERQEKLEMMKRSSEPSGLLTTAFNSIMNKQLNPLQESLNLFKGLKEVGLDPFGARDYGRTREMIDSENDWKLALLHEEMEVKKMTHEWDLQARANEDSKEQMVLFINALTNVTAQHIAPKVGKFIDGWLGGEKRGPPQGPPSQPQHMHPPHHHQPEQQRVPPGSVLVMTEQGPMWMKMGPQPQRPPSQPGMGMPGMGQPSQEQPFEALEEGRVMRQAEHLSRVAQELAQRETALRDYEGSLIEKENSLAQASAYVEGKAREVNAEKQQIQFQRERQSFEEYTKSQLQDEFKAMANRMDKIQQAIAVKDREEKEYKQQEVKDAQELDTEPIAVSPETPEDIYQGEYEEDRSAAVKHRQDTQHTNPVANPEDQNQDQTDTASG